MLNKNKMINAFAIMVAFLFLGSTVTAQTIMSAVDQTADWSTDGDGWVVDDSQANAGGIQGTPAGGAGFVSFDDDAAGPGSAGDSLTITSPVIDLTPALSVPASMGGPQTTLEITIPLFFQAFVSSDNFTTSWWDADAGMWVAFPNCGCAAPQPTGFLSYTDDAFGTGGPPPTNCGGTTETTGTLDISGFSANQLANFQLQMGYYDGGALSGSAGWGWGFTMCEPQVRSVGPCVGLTLPEISGLANDSICADQLNIVLTGNLPDGAGPAPAPASGTFTIFDPNNNLIASDTDGDVDFLPAGNTPIIGAGAYTINYTADYSGVDAACVFTVTESVVILDDTAPFVGLQGGGEIPGVICSDDAPITIDWGPQVSTDYVITGPNGFISTTQTNIDPSTLAPGTYNIVVMPNDLSCATGTATAQFTILDVDATGAFVDENGGFSNSFVCQSEDDFSINLTEYLEDGSGVLNGGTFTMGALPPFFSEIDYANEPQQFPGYLPEQDFFEIVAPVNVDLSDYAVYFYRRAVNETDMDSDANCNLEGMTTPITFGNTTGMLYRPPGLVPQFLVDGWGLPLNNANCSTTILTASNGVDYKVCSFNIADLEDDVAAGLALVNISGGSPGPDDVVQFIGYGIPTQPQATNLAIFTACEGPARGLISHDVDVVDGGCYSIQFTNAGWVVPNVDDYELNYPVGPDFNAADPFNPGCLGERYSPGAWNWGMTDDAQGGGADEFYFDYIAPSGDILDMSRLDLTLFLGGQTVGVEEFDPITGDPLDNNLVEFSCANPTYSIPFNYNVVYEVPCVPADQLTGDFNLTVLMDIEDDWMSPMVVCENQDPFNLTHLIDDGVQWIQPVMKSIDTFKTETLELNNYPAPRITEIIYNDYGATSSSIDDHCVLYNYIDLNEFGLTDDPQSAYGTQRFCEGVEISGLTGTDLSCYALAFYDFGEINQEEPIEDQATYALLYDVLYIGPDGLPVETDVQTAADDNLDCPFGSNRLMQLYGNIDTDECFTDGTTIGGFNGTNSTPDTDLDSDASFWPSSGQLSAQSLITVPLPANTILYPETLPFTVANYNGPDPSAGNPADPSTWDLDGTPPATAGLYHDLNFNGEFDAGVDTLLAAVAGDDCCSYLDDSFYWEQCEDAVTSDGNSYLNLLANFQDPIPGYTYGDGNITCDMRGRGQVGSRWFPIADIHDFTGAIGLVNTCNCELHEFLQYGKYTGELTVGSASDFSLAGPFADSTAAHMINVESGAITQLDNDGTGQNSGDLQSIQLLVPGDETNGAFEGGLWFIADGTSTTFAQDIADATGAVSADLYNGNELDSQPISNTVGYFNCALDPISFFPTPECVEVDVRDCLPDNFIIDELTVGATVQNAANYKWIIGDNWSETSIPLVYDFNCPENVVQSAGLSQSQFLSAAPSITNNYTANEAISSAAVFNIIQQGCTLFDNDPNDLIYPGLYDQWEDNCGVADYYGAADDACDDCVCGSNVNCYCGERFNDGNICDNIDTYFISNPNGVFEDECARVAERVYKFCIVGHPVGGEDNYTATLSVDIKLKQCAPIGYWCGKGVEMVTAVDCGAPDTPENRAECLWVFNPMGECYGAAGSINGLSDCSPVAVTYNTNNADYSNYFGTDANGHPTCEINPLEIQNDNAADDLNCLDDDNDNVRTQLISVVSANVADLVEDQAYCLSDLQDGLFGDGIDLTEFLGQMTPANGYFNIVDSPADECFSLSGYIFYPECVGTYSVEHVVAGSGLCEDRDTLMVTITEPLDASWEFSDDILVQDQAATVCNDGVTTYILNDLVDFTGSSITATVDTEVATDSAPLGSGDTQGSAIVNVPAVPCDAEVAGVKVCYKYDAPLSGAGIIQLFAPWGPINVADYEQVAPDAGFCPAGSDGAAVENNTCGCIVIDDFEWTSYSWETATYTDEAGMYSAADVAGNWELQVTSAAFPWEITLDVEVEYVRGSFTGLGLNYLGDGIYEFVPYGVETTGTLEPFNNIDVTYNVGCGDICQDVEPSTNLLHVIDGAASAIVATAGCADANGNVVVTVDYLGGGTLTWGSNNIPVVGGSFTVNANDFSEVSISAAEGICVGAETVAIYGPISVSATTPNCGDTNVLVSVAGGAGAPYSYSLNGGQDFAPLVNGVVPVQGGVQNSILFTDVLGQCTSAPLVITAPAASPIATSMPMVSDCDDVNQTVTVSFTISGGEAPYTVNGMPSGDTFVMTIDASNPSGGTMNYVVAGAGCSIGTSVSVDIPFCNAPQPIQAEDHIQGTFETGSTVNGDAGDLLNIPNSNGNVDTGLGIEVTDVCTTSTAGIPVLWDGTTWTYNPDGLPNDLTSDSFCYTITDDLGQTDVALVFLNFEDEVMPTETSVTASPVCEYEDENEDVPTGFFNLIVTVNTDCSGELTYVDNNTGNGDDVPMVGASTGIIEITGLQADSGNGYSISVFCDGELVGTVEDVVNCAKATSIELVKFDGEVRATDNFLTWETATEDNNAYFTLERSTDGSNYETIAVIDGAGTTNVSQFYNYADVDAPMGVSFYRLSWTDFNGKTVSHEDVVRLTRTSTTDFGLINVYPVPATDMLNVEFVTGISADVIVRVYDVTGKLVTENNVDAETGFNNYQLDIRTLPTGNYFLTLTSGSKVETAQFIKE